MALAKTIGKSRGFAQQSTHEHYKGEFSSRIKSRQERDSGSARKPSAQMEAHGRLIRAAQSMKKAHAATKAHDSAKTHGEKETHAREAMRHASSARAHAEKVTATSHAAAAEHVRSLAEKVHQRMSMSAKEHAEATKKDPPASNAGRTTSASRPVGPFGVRSVKSSSAHESEARGHLAAAEKSVRDHVNARTHVDKLRHAATALSHVKRAEASATAAGHLGLLRRADQVSKLGKLVMKQSESAHSTRLAGAAREHAKRSQEARRAATAATSDVERRLHEKAASEHKRAAIRHATSVVEDFVRHGKGVSHVSAMETLVGELRSRKKLSSKARKK